MNMADENNAESQEEKPKSGSKKLLIIGLFLGLLLGGGGGYGAFMMLGSVDVEEEQIHEEEIIVEEPKKEYFFVKVDRVTLPIIYKKRIRGNVMIDFSMKVDSNENKMTVINHLPEIRDAMLRHYSDTTIGKEGSPRSVDYDRLKKNLMEISNKVLHDSVILDVLIVQSRIF